MPAPDSSISAVAAEPHPLHQDGGSCRPAVWGLSQCAVRSIMAMLRTLPGAARRSSAWLAVHVGLFFKGLVLRGARGPDARAVTDDLPAPDRSALDTVAIATEQASKSGIFDHTDTEILAEIIEDLIADLCHLADRAGLDVDVVLDHGRGHFLYERHSNVATPDPNGVDPR